MSNKNRKSNHQIREDNQQYIAQCVARLCSGKEFTREQITIIRSGLAVGLSYSQVELYAQPEYHPKVMKKIQRDLRIGIPFSDIMLYIHKSGNLAKQIRSDALFEVYRTSKKAQAISKPGASDPQEPQIIQTKKKANNNDFSSAQLNQIQAGMRNKKVARGEHLFRKPKLTVKQIIQIQVGLENGLSLEQVEFYAHPKFNDFQMAQIRRGFENGLSIDDVREYARKKFSADEMRTMREQKETLLKLSEGQPYDHHQEQKKSEENTSKPETPMPQTKIFMEPTQGISTAKTSFFSHQFETSLKLQYKNTWNAWLQSKQVFLYEDSFAASILADSAAVECVECEVLCRCPYTSCYIEAQEACGNKLSFFAVLTDNILRLLPVEGEVVGRLHELRIDQHFDCGEMLAAIDDSKVKSQVMKMLQLYVCLCSAELVDVQPTGSYVLVATREPRQSDFHSGNQGIPRWDVNVYTVAMQRITKKNRRRQKSENDTDTVPRRSHKRRAHWHHYWVGSRDDAASRHRIVKWVSEIDVNPTEDDLPVRIILVKRQ